MTQARRHEDSIQADILDKLDHINKELMRMRLQIDSVVLDTNLNKTASDAQLGEIQEQLTSMNKFNISPEKHFVMHVKLDKLDDDTINNLKSWSDEYGKMRKSLFRIALYITGILGAIASYFHFKN